MITRSCSYNIALRNKNGRKEFRDKRNKYLWVVPNISKALGPSGPSVTIGPPIDVWAAPMGCLLWGASYGMPVLAVPYGLSIYGAVPYGLPQ